MTKFVEDLNSIAIQKLTRTTDWQERDIYISQKGFHLEWLFVKLINDPIYHDWYLEILNPGPHCSCTAITIIETKCSFGGYRYWFQCPDCEQRCGVIYKKDDNFKCRNSERFYLLLMQAQPSM